MDKSKRNLIQKATQDARKLLEDEFGRQLEGTFDILPDGTVAPEPGEHLDPAQRIVRRKIVAAIEHEKAGGLSKKEAAAAYLREAAFTFLNRFVALKMVEARGLSLECVSKAEQSSGFKEFCGLAPGLAELPDKGYRLYIESLFDELSTEIKVLFDRRNPASLLWPRQKVLEELLAILNREAIKDVWAEDETIGWIYQYFNPKDERDAMRKASRSPRNTIEMAVRNQFFTPRYVVEFLTDNTLGRIWYEMRRGDTVLKYQCRYLVRRPNEVFLPRGEKIPPDSNACTDLPQCELLKQAVFIEHRDKKDPRDLKTLDPACGSGHFLLYVFDLLEKIYEEAWGDPESPQSEITGQTLQYDFESLDQMQREVPKLILEHNLHGIDIDPRAAQIATLALWLRAQKTWGKIGIKAVERPRIVKSNIVAAEPMPGEEEMRRDFIAELKPRVLGQVLEQVFSKMKLAGEVGSLLEIEEEIKETVAEANKQWMKGPKPEQQLLFPGMAAPRPIQQELRFDVKSITDERFWEQAEERILHALKTYAERAENGGLVRRRLFAEDAARGFAFIDLCRNRYDAILMNPPFGASSRDSKGYIEGRYSKTKGDVLANFIERMLHLTTDEGRIGAITSRTPFFLGSFETLRTNILGKVGHIRIMADLGEGVLEAMVETAMYVIDKNRGDEAGALFFRLLIDSDKGGLLRKLAGECLNGDLSDRTFVINPKHFKKLSGNPYAYWASKATIEILSEHPIIEGNKAEIRVGLQTSDDFRFLRLLWEVPPKSIVLGTSEYHNETVQEHCLHALNQDKRWVPYSKTDIALPWYSPINLVVNWAYSGSEIKAFATYKGNSPSRNVRSENEYFKPGFSYMLRSTRLVPYLVPSSIVPTAGRAQIFPGQGEEYAVLGICASNIGSAIARFSGEKFAWPKFQASMVQGLPSCKFSEDTLNQIKEHVDAEVNKRRAVVQKYEPYQEFKLPAWIHSAEAGETVWDLYSLFGRDLEIKIAEAFGLNPAQLVELERDIREAGSIRGHSEAIESEIENSNDEEEGLNVELILETPEEKAVGLFMYAVGVAFGRWDVRIALYPSLAPKLANPFDPLPVSPPGMLVGSDGLPAEPKCIVSKEWLRARLNSNTIPSEGAVQKPIIEDSEYPLLVSWDGILVDDPGFEGGQLHDRDIVLRAREVLEVLWKDKASEIEEETCEILKVPDLRTYFRKSFFADHIKRYSKSRRKAPIYWQLSTPSSSYSIWLYYHRFTKDLFYQVLHDYAEPKLRFEERELANIRQQYGDSPTAEQRKEIAARESFVAELADFKEEIARVAPLWNPNLNDGVVINFAPLWRLVPQNKPWQKECKQTWDKLVEGEFDWAHLAMHLWPDRVVPKCAKDRSLAIAHGLDEVFWEEDDKGKPKSKKVSKETLDSLVRERTSPSVKAALDDLLKAPGGAGPAGKKRKKRS